MIAGNKKRDSKIDLYDIFSESSDPVLTAVEVGDELGISQQAAHSRLSNAHESGDIERKKVGSRAVVWWLPDQDSESA
ncbi:response regulator of citrate/malate metabolism [Halobellus sp. H-GB7]|uniref:response regulator of citrate/malate metabolism n=1 Tax=Halobellus sp. H-GB7 TaxID=3069756 RepID=UPI0027B7C1B4|nr:response regulator of citrate/malate metabolism [Halobellus sp. H-GB7]MDQ2055962.1 response regulator of citrate/malate metabolism [Halobellus sp. H-GB7]